MRSKEEAMIESESEEEEDMDANADASDLVRDYKVFGNYLENQDLPGSVLQSVVLLTVDPLVARFCCCKFLQQKLTLVAQSDGHPTGDQEVTGSIPTRPATFFDHEIFSTVIFPFCWFKKGSSQFLVKEFAQVLINHLED